MNSSSIGREGEPAPAGVADGADARVLSAPPLADALARARFRDEWQQNFCVSANAGSGKTTAISERLAAMALAPGAADRLRRTAVVTYTKKAAAQIGQRARQVLLRRLQEAGQAITPLDHLERAFFGTIHSFCLKLAQTYGQTLGINLNPTVVAEDDETLWETFLEEDPMTFQALPAAERQVLLRHVPLEVVFACARQLDSATADSLARRVRHAPVPPDAAALAQLLACPAKGAGARNVLASQERARQWHRRWAEETDFLPLYEPAGRSAAVLDCAAAWMAPLKRWLADAAGALAAELAQRYRTWRFERGVQTYADQIDAAMAVLRDEVMLDRIRRDGWRIILDEAQDTDPQQFAVLVEITRPPGAPRGTWPPVAGAGAVAGPRPGHFCLVGDGQQAIYGSRADIGNFTRHVEAFRQGRDGELLEFQVTFRTPQAVIARLNATLPEAFGPRRLWNLGLAPAPDAPPPVLQVPYVPLVAGPANAAGMIRRLPLRQPTTPPQQVQGWLVEEARQLAEWCRVRGPAGLGAQRWGEVAFLAPRNDWLVTVRKELEGAGLEVALQSRRTRCGDNPPYAWVAGLLAVCVDPENPFEWVGVLREVFGLSDALLAEELRKEKAFRWEEPEVHPTALAQALQRVRPLILRANDEGEPLEAFARELVDAGALRAKAARVDPSGGMNAELDRLVARAAELGLEGGGPRRWWADVLAELDNGRATGKPTGDAINLLTSHSAKGLEWPVVVVVGLWRGIGKPPDAGLKLVREAGGARLFYDRASLPPETQEARERERVRELVRLLYVTLTRAKQVLILPWLEDFGGKQRETPCFAELWGADLKEIPALEAADAATAGPPPATDHEPPVAAAPEGRPAPALPQRVLPHELAHQSDAVRMVRHESTQERLPSSAGEEGIEYGLWWHETMEFLPWTGSTEELDRYGEEALQKAAELGFAIRAQDEWKALRGSAAWATLTAGHWQRLAELGVFAPVGPDRWVDGVVDLVLFNETTQELRVVDWKTNRRRAGETPSTLLARLAAEYRPQLSAYAQCLAPFFPGAAVACWLYASSAGDWLEVT